MTKDEILKHSLTLHNLMGSQVDAEDKEAFDVAHRQIWGDCEDDLSLRHTEMVAKPKLTDDEKHELKELNYWFQVTK